LILARRDHEPRSKAKENVSTAEKIVDVVYDIAKGRRAIRYVLTPLGFVVFLGMVAVLIILAPLVDTFLGFPRFLPLSLHLWISLPVIACGAFLVMWSMFHFLKVKGTPVPFDPPPQVVTTGPYRYVRNPMLSGLCILMFGLGGLMRSWSLTFIIVPLFIVFNILELKIIEEPELVKRLGDDYVKYRNRTPMFIPWLGEKRE
jgi:protein-S-isoprenylcysteine O-methyltransferase Ste14